MVYISALVCLFFLFHVILLEFAKEETLFLSSCSISDTSVHYFICMIRNGAHVVVTQMMSTHDAMVQDSLDFPNLIQLKDIKQNFRFDLEIYGMVRKISRHPKKIIIAPVSGEQSIIPSH